MEKEECLESLNRLETLLRNTIAMRGRAKKSAGLAFRRPKVRRCPIPWVNTKFELGRMIDFVVYDTILLLFQRPASNADSADNDKQNVKRRRKERKREEKKSMKELIGEVEVGETIFCL